MFTQQAFSQNDGKNTYECDTQNSKNNKACEVPKNTTANQQVPKTTIKIPQKVEKASKSTVKKPLEVEKRQQKIVVKTIPKRSNLVLQTQQQLNRLGFNAGPADGLMGKKTKEAITLFQKRNHIHVDGKTTSVLLDKLKKVRLK